MRSRRKHYTGQIHSIAMSHPFVTTLASRLAVPEPVVEELARAVAERCALIANREGSYPDAPSGAAGAMIGAAILAAFTPSIGMPEGGGAAETDAAGSLR